MKTSESLLSKGKFIAEYSAHLMGAGVNTPNFTSSPKASPIRLELRTRRKIRSIS